jgi:general secretion pathway protein K
VSDHLRSTLARCGRILAARHHRRRSKRDRESGVALLITISTLALMVALVAEFTYDTSIHAAQAANARDEVRAHYLARSSISLSRLVIRIQQRFIDPIMNNIQRMVSGATGAQGQTGATPGQPATQGGDLGFSLRITDYVGPILGFFGGSKEEVSSLGSMLGFDMANAKGLGMNWGKMDAEISSEDGKINLNCGSGSAATRKEQTMVYRLLSALMYSPRYKALFERRNEDGQFIDRGGLASGLIDWADADEQMFSPVPGGGGTEDYRYDAGDDPYRAHNNYYDTVEEVGLVRGMDANFLEAFQEHFTVYASHPECKVNLRVIKGDCTPLLVGLIRAAVMPVDGTPPADPTILDDQRLYPVASVLCERGTAVGFDDLNTIVQVLNNPAASIARDDPRYEMMQSMRPIQIKREQLDTVALTGPPRVYRIVATGEAGKVKKKITAVIDTKRVPDNPVTSNPQAEGAAGVMQYWREE